MHPPAFHATHRLSDWPHCRLELRCPGCGNVAYFPIDLLIEQFGDRSFRAVLDKLRCRRCRSAPAPIYLLADLHREFCFGAPPGWAIELKPKPP